MEYIGRTVHGLPAWRPLSLMPCRMKGARGNAMDSSNWKGKPQRILVFQQNGSGENKTGGIRRFGGDRFIIQTFDIDVCLPGVLEQSSGYLPETIDADMVIDHLEHPDLSSDLWFLCERLGIPVVASGRKSAGRRAVTPRTCCSLPRREDLGEYGRRFGTPEFEVKVVEGRLAGISVLHGAPCGATWEAAEQTVGIRIEEAPRHIGLRTQFLCKANPAGWDVLHGKSPVHVSAELHRAALERAWECLKAKGDECNAGIRQSD